MSQLSTNISEFEKALAAETSAMLGDVPKFIRDVSTDAIQQILAATPVKTGHAKYNWLVTLGSARLGERAGYDKSPLGDFIGPTHTDALVEISKINPTTSQVVISNSTDYIDRIMEYGSSVQSAPGTFSAILQRLEAKWL